MNVLTVQNYPFAYTILDKVIDVVPYACITYVATAILFEGLWLLNCRMAFTASAIVAGVTMSKALTVFFKTMQINFPQWDLKTGIHFNILSLVETPLKFCQGALVYLPLLFAAGGVASLALRLLPFAATTPILPATWLASLLVAEFARLYTNKVSSSEVQEWPFSNVVRHIENIAVGICFGAIIAIPLVYPTYLLTMAPISFPIAFFITAGGGTCMMLSGKELLASKFGIEKGSVTYSSMVLALNWLNIIGSSAYVINSLPFSVEPFFVVLGGLGFVLLVAKIVYSSLKNSSELELLCRHARWGSNEAVMKLYKSYLKHYEMYNSTPNGKAFLEKIVDWLRNSAARNFAPAQYVLAKFVFSNNLNMNSKVRKNIFELMQMSAEQGHAPALFWLGKYYYNSNELEKGIHCLLKAYENGSDKALAYLRKHCLTDTLIIQVLMDLKENGQDFLEKIVDCLRDSANKEFAPAQYTLAKFVFSHNLRVNSKERKDIFKMMQMWADQGHAPALYWLGKYYYNSNELEKGIHCLLKAYENGSDKALAYLRNLCLSDTIINRVSLCIMEAVQKKSKIDLYNMAKYLIQDKITKGLGRNLMSEAEKLGSKRAAKRLCLYYFTKNRVFEAYEILARYEDTDLEQSLLNKALDLYKHEETKLKGLKIFSGIGFRPSSLSQGKNIRLEAMQVVYHHYSFLETSEGDQIFLDLIQSQIDQGCVVSKAELGYFYINRSHYTKGVMLLREVSQHKAIDEDEIEMIEKVGKYLLELHAGMA